MARKARVVDVDGDGEGKGEWRNKGGRPPGATLTTLNAIRLEISRLYRRAKTDFMHSANGKVKRMTPAEVNSLSGLLERARQSIMDQETEQRLRTIERHLASMGYQTATTRDEDHPPPHKLV